jgi:hypothetical protein
VPQRLADVAEGSGVNKATALRLLESLIDEGFVVRDEATRRYALGDEALALGIAMQGRDHIRDRARPTLLRLAAATGDTLLLSVRSGVESVCVDREFGSYPIRANYLDLGMRRPLGVGAGSLALLAWLPDDEVETVLGLIAPRITQRHPRISIELLRTRGLAVAPAWLCAAAGRGGGPDGRHRRAGVRCRRPAHRRHQPGGAEHAHHAAPVHAGAAAAQGGRRAVARAGARW